MGPSRFWMVGGHVPEPNEDTKKLFEAYTYLPHTFQLRKWSLEEDAALEKLLLQNVKVSPNASRVRISALALYKAGL